MCSPHSTQRTEPTIPRGTCLCTRALTTPPVLHRCVQTPATAQASTTGVESWQQMGELTPRVGRGPRSTHTTELRNTLGVETWNRGLATSTQLVLNRGSCPVCLDPCLALLKGPMSHPCPPTRASPPSGTHGPAAPVLPIPQTWAPTSSPPPCPKSCQVLSTVSWYPFSSPGLILAALTGSSVQPPITHLQGPNPSHDTLTHGPPGPWPMGSGLDRGYCPSQGFP